MGVVATSLVGKRFNVAVLGWLAPVPWLAYTRLDNLPLPQTTSLFGLTGVSVLLAAGSLVLAPHLFGAFRLHRPLPGPLVTVATVSTDLELGSDGSLPTTGTIAQANDTLFLRSAQAMERGAQIVSWNEGFTGVEQSDEAAFLSRGQRLATQHDADLVVAYVVPLQDTEGFENKYAWLTPEGVAETYLKHYPVRREGSVRGTDPIRVHQRPSGGAA